LLDRIDLHVDVPSVAYKELTNGDAGKSSQMIRERVERCRAVQTERFKADKGVNTNSAMTPRLIKKHCELDAEGGHFLEHSMGEMNFSARAHDRILKVARTLADLGGLDKISADNVLEAVQYRTLDRKLWVEYQMTQRGGIMQRTTPEPFHLSRGTGLFSFATNRLRGQGQSIASWPLRHLPPMRSCAGPFFAVRLHAVFARPTCEKAWGKLPSMRFARGSYCSASSPRSLRIASSRSNTARASSLRPISK